MNYLPALEKGTKALINNPHGLARNIAKGEKLYEDHVAPVVEKSIEKVANTFGFETRQQRLSKRDFSQLPDSDLIEKMLEQREKSLPEQKRIPVPRNKPTKNKSNFIAQNSKQNHSAKKCNLLTTYQTKSRKNFTPSFPSMPGDWKGQSVLLGDMIRESRRSLVKTIVTEIVCQIHSRDAQIRTRNIRKLKLNGKNPPWVNRLLKITPIVDALVLIQEDILKHPKAIMSGYSKNTDELSAAPKRSQSIKVFYCTSNPLPESIWDWIWEGRKKPKKLKAGGANQKAIFNSYQGVPKKTIGLTSASDLLSIDRRKKLAPYVYELTMTAKLVQHTVVNAEVLKLLNYMGSLGKPIRGTYYRSGLNIRGCYGYRDNKRGIIYPAFREDRKYTDSFLPSGYPHPYPSEDVELGKWLLRRYRGHKLALNEMIIGGVGSSKKGPIHRVLSEKKHRTTNSILATFGLVLKTLGPKGVSQLTQKYKKDPQRFELLKDVSLWLSLFQRPKEYVKVGKKGTISFQGNILKQDDLPEFVRKQWLKTGLKI